MDFASFKNYIELYGFKKTNTSGIFTNFNTTFSQGNNLIIVTWQMGGHISKICLKESNKADRTYNSMIEFLETLKK